MNYLVYINGTLYTRCAEQGDAQRWALRAILHDAYAYARVDHAGTRETVYAVVGSKVR